MQLLPVRHLWGVSEPWEHAVPRFAGIAYKAIETPLPGGPSPVEPADEPRFGDLLREHGLRYVPMAFTGGVTVADHLASLRAQIRQAKVHNPLHLTVHGGQDRFTLDEAVAFYREAVKIEAGEGIRLAHETHRGRVFYNPWRTAELLERVPEVRLCCDFSHWVVVAERLLDGDEAIVRLAASKCIHVHCRVGYPQGPQVPDPSAPEARGPLERHEAWWREVWNAQKAAGATDSSFTPEFGPPEYLHTLPTSGFPVADLASVCEWMRARYEATFESWAAGK